MHYASRRPTIAYGRQQQKQQASKRERRINTCVSRRGFLPKDRERGIDRHIHTCNRE
ncbi:hypothetical protein WH47_01884 [Habropoda laboriosa]|uniref:Uncharacterized protein n=1 Tax=Habropoda laboriosa TaxID=597456 RepID=A0A0L7QXQ6_9HYME|nr:hypothetical protein WH47_01884 [Habropoda laboriosa]